jgi:hypothetical protein
VREALVPRGGFESEQRAHVGDLELSHVDSKNASSGDFISLYGKPAGLNNHAFDRAVLRLAPAPAALLEHVNQRPSKLRREPLCETSRMRMSNNCC